ncbi:MAG: hypothetical protein J7604_14410 [Sporocytophaga sp.]|uniref:hypothetical protein n=1 Tax=Sporocytophaga sp. TaxID=2231183 RepID=UPI001B019B54|nr:hypothetical protein [Sporocytophaga sp.]MBO9701398.1 hypothetical protein [Sporocytophaga sp.]
MRSDKEHIDLLIEKYTKGKLAGEKLETFEKLLAENPEFKRKAELVKVTNQLVVLNRLSEVNIMLKAETASLKKKENGNSNKGKFILGISALAMLISIVIFISQSDKESRPARIINKDQRTVDKSASSVLTPLQKKEIWINNDHNNNGNSKSVEEENQEDMMLSPGKMIVDTVSINMEHSADTSVIHNIHQLEVKNVKSNPSQADKKIASCEGIRITVDLKTEGPCRGEQNGRIMLNRVRGGTEPYSYVLNGNEENSQGQFSDLVAGNYQIKITDHNGCHISLNQVTLSERRCRKDLEFSPSHGEELQMPVYEKSGNLSIFDKTGKLYYQQSIPAREKFMWNGLSNSGELIAGYYVFVIQYEDGSDEKGSITIAP